MADKEPLEIKHSAPSEDAITRESVRESIRKALENDEFVSKVRDALVKSDHVAMSLKHELRPPKPTKHTHHQKKQ
jgi:hypothetical protein